MAIAVEGPSVHALADDLAFLEGQRIESTVGNARQPIDQLEGCRIERVRAVKKRLVIETDGPAAVIHFLMYGTYRINERRDTEPRLSLRCEEDEFNVYSCSAKIVEDLSDLDPTGDVLSDRFDAERARQALAEDRMVADILLDQDVFGGVGNIVKNEALLEAGVDPRRSGSQLTEDEREALFDAAVGLTTTWYEHEDGARAIIRIYQKGECPDCGADTRRENLSRFDRLTIWCPACQPTEPAKVADDTGSGAR